MGVVKNFAGDNIHLSIINACTRGVNTKNHRSLLETGSPIYIP